MGKDVTIFVGTIGQGIWRSRDGGETWDRSRLQVRPGRFGVSGESEVRAFAVHPRDQGTVYAGADTGVYRTRDGGDSWEKLESPMLEPRMNEVPIWVLAVDPVDPDTIFAGTRPSALFRTRDAGRSWEKLSVELVDECPNVVVPRVTALMVDPVDHNSIWAGIEVDGVRHSTDGGDTWETVAAGITDPDIHHMAVTMGPPKTLLTITPGEVFSSTDDGRTWEPAGAAPQVSLPYCRAVAVKEDDPNVVYMGSGEGAYGGVGALHRSADMGRTWESIPLTVKPNGTVHNFGTHPSDPSFLAASSINGQVFVSSDAGDSWSKVSREWGIVHALAWVPS
jgi:photosystem II stability/assembly factor-like uncharacterized protein